MISNVQFFKASELDGNVKATVHRSGKLGFNANAQKKLKLDENRYLKIGITEDMENVTILYVLPHKEEDVDSFTVAKSGDYFYANTKPLFDALNMDYDRKKIIFDIVEAQAEGQKYFKFKKREIERKKDDKEEND